MSYGGNSVAGLKHCFAQQDDFPGASKTNIVLRRLNGVELGDCSLLSDVGLRPDVHNVVSVQDAAVPFW